MSAIVVRDLIKEYTSGPSTVRVLDHLSLDVARGERLAVLGRSGSGKSTLLHLLGGLDTPTAGTLGIEGVDLHSMTSNQRADFRLRVVGIIFQSFHLVAARSARENVELPMIFAGVRTSERRRAAAEALEAVGLADRMHHRPEELSGGERQRVAVARALANRPRLLLADEPTGNLDSVTADGIMNLLLDCVRREGMTLILVTHDEPLATRSADRIVRVRDGRIVESTT